MGCQCFLRDQSTPCPIKAILAATSYDYEAGRKMLIRMRLAGELVSLPGSLCTHHPPPLPCHLHSPRPTPTTDQATSENTQKGETAFVRMSPALILAKATLHYTISPPSTTSECPVTNEAPSEQSQMTASAMSCGWPSRCRGISDMMRAVVSGSLPTRRSYIEV